MSLIILCYSPMQ